MIVPEDELIKARMAYVRSFKGKGKTRPRSCGGNAVTDLTDYFKDDDGKLSTEKGQKVYNTIQDVGDVTTDWARNLMAPKKQKRESNGEIHAMKITEDNIGQMPDKVKDMIVQSALMKIHLFKQQGYTDEQIEEMLRTMPDRNLIRAALGAGRLTKKSCRNPLTVRACRGGDRGGIKQMRAKREEARRRAENPINTRVPFLDTLGNFFLNPKKRRAFTEETADKANHYADQGESILSGYAGEDD